MHLPYYFKKMREIFEKLRAEKRLIESAVSKGVFLSDANTLLRGTTDIPVRSDTLRTVCSSGMEAACINQ
jgi:hypothetical protein